MSISQISGIYLTVDSPDTALTHKPFYSERIDATHNPLLLQGTLIGFAPFHIGGRNRKRTQPRTRSCTYAASCEAAGSDREGINKSEGPMIELHRKKCLPL